jgi:hypothetical protein
MTRQEQMLRDNKKKEGLLRSSMENPPKTQNEKDIFNLKYMLYDICYHRAYSYKKINTLKRVIKMLEGKK